jgi:hypothetical protein
MLYGNNYNNNNYNNYDKKNTHKKKLSTKVFLIVTLLHENNIKQRRTGVIT